LKLKQTPPDGSYPLKVPIGGAKLVQSALERNGSLREPVSRPGDLHRGKAPPAIHVVKRGETAHAVAKRYGISVADLLRWNNLAGDVHIRAGDRLRVAAVSNGGQRPPK
jgi:LysM repeat protein